MKIPVTASEHQAFEHGRAVVRQRREREHAAWLAARNAARKRDQPHIADEKKPAPQARRPESSERVSSV